MLTGHTTSLPLSTWARDTLRTIALAYRRIRRLGERDLPANKAAEVVYQARHPTEAPTDMQRTVALMIAAVAGDHPDGRWRG